MKHNQTTKSSIYVIVITFLSLFFYYKTISFDFVWDDKELYLTPKKIPLENPLSKFYDNILPQKDKMYIPVTYFFWSLIAYLGGVQDGQFVASWYHWFNLILHTLNAILVFFLLLKLLNSDFAAFFGALVFALHPIQIETVAWISEARGLLSAFFGFLSLLLFVNSKNLTVTRKITIALFTLLSILSKPSGVVFPLLLILLDWYKEPGETLMKLFKRNWYLLALLVPFIFISFRGEATKVIEFETPLFLRPIIWINAIGFYLQKLFLPFDFSPGYGVTYKFLSKNPVYFYYSVITIVFVIIGFLIRVKKEYWFGLLIFVVGFLPVSNLFTFYYQYWSTVADRYVYVSVFGFSFFLSFILQKYLYKYRYLVTAFVVVVSLLLFYKELPKWKDEFSLWDDCINKYPDRIPQVYLGRGMILETQGKMHSALEDYSKSIEIDTSFYFGYYNRGNIYFDLKRYDKAISDFSAALRFNPKYVDAYVNRGLCYLESQIPDKAIEDFSRALELDSTQIDVYVYLGEAYENVKDFRNAYNSYQKAFSRGYNTPMLIERMKALEERLK
jgi:Tfp pilus assembly protein PilF